MSASDPKRTAIGPTPTPSEHQNTLLPSRVRASGAVMRRREFISLVGGSIALWPLMARAQQPAIPVIGYLGIGLPADSLTRTDALRAGLQEFGYIDGKNVRLEFRFAEKPEQLHKFAVELTQSQAAIIVTSGNAATTTVKSVASEIPIIFSVADDPVRLELVSSLNRPGAILRV